jgi:PhzF family phenazine biosynthesis protein
MLQTIAAENNLPATAFFRYESESCAIRWFTPTVELPLCGHGMLAAAHVILNLLDTSASRIVFNTKAATLTASRHGGGLALDLPLNRAAPCAPPPGLAEALGKAPTAVLTTRNYLAVFDCAEDVAGMTPDFAALAQLHCVGVIVTAPGRDGIHCVSRYFAPSPGVDEDAVTGSAHCTLVPYWSGRLGKSTIVARQISLRGGVLTGAQNAKSRAAAKRLGFRFEGIWFNHLVFKGRNRDTAWYSILDSEWPALREAIRAWLNPANFDAAGRAKQSLSAMTAAL